MGAEYLADFKGVVEAARVISALARIEWEYYWAKVDPTDPIVFEMGRDGWECIGQVYDGLMFKRPKIDTTPELKP